MSPRRLGSLWADSFRKTRVDVVYLGSLFVLAFLLVRPLWLLTYLPLGDLPEHAAQIRLILAFDAHRHDYTIQWFTPYLTAYGLTLLFTRLVPLMTAIKLTLSLALIGIPLAAAALIRSLRGNRYWVWTAFPAAYSFAFYWGFFSYVVATPLAIAFLAFAVWYGKAPSNGKTYALAAALSLMLFFSHALAWMFATVIASAIIFIDAPLSATAKKASAFFVTLPLIVYWTSLRGVGQSGVELGDYSSHFVARITDIVQFMARDLSDRYEGANHWDRLKEMLSLSIGQPPMGDFIFLALLYLSSPLWLGARFSRNWTRWLPLALTVAAFLVTPYWLFDTAYVYERFAVFVIPLSFFVFDHAPAGDHRAEPVRLRRLALGAGSLALVSFMLLRTNVVFTKFRSNDEDFKAVLAAMKPEKRVMSLIFDQTSPFKYSPPYMHFACWYQVDKLGIVAPSFSTAVDAPVPVQFVGEPGKLPSAWAPGTFDWNTHEGSKYDYFLVRSDVDREGLFKESRGAVALLARRGAWQLYGRIAEN